MTATYEYSTSTGMIVPDTQDLLDDVRAEYKSALGENLNVESATPQGSLIQSETIARTHVMRNNAEVANLINPNYSYGVALDALMFLTGSDRGANMSTFVRRVRLEGNPQTFIARGSRVATSDGAIFIISQDVTIGISGVENGVIESVVYGDITVHQETLRIIDGVTGWGAAIIAENAIIEPGTARLSDAAARNARMRRLFALGRSSTGAIKAAALKVPNVRSVNVIENNTGAPGTIHGVTFTKPSAMWVCVDGQPDKKAMADALLEAHRGGCPWDYGGLAQGDRQDPPNGTVGTDYSTGLGYNVLWTKAVLVDAWIKIQVRQGVGGADPRVSIPPLIMDYAEGRIAGEDGFVVGARISGFDMAGAISAQMPGLYIASVRIAFQPAGGGVPPDNQYVIEGYLGAWYAARAALGRISVEVLV